MVNLKKLFFPKLYEKQEKQKVKNELSSLLTKVKDGDIVFEKMIDPKYKEFITTHLLTHVCIYSKNSNNAVKAFAELKSLCKNGVTYGNLASIAIESSTEEVAKMACDNFFSKENFLISLAEKLEERSKYIYVKEAAKNALLQKKNTLGSDEYHNERQTEIAALSFL